MGKKIIGSKVPAVHLTQEQKDQEFKKFLIHGWRERDIPRIKELIAAGVNVNEVGKDGETMLMKLSVGDRIGLMTLLLQAGADPNMYCRIVTVPGLPGPDHAKKVLRMARRTALMNAAHNNKPANVKLLLKEGADRQMTNIANEDAADLARLRMLTNIVDLLTKMQKLP